MLVQFYQTVVDFHNVSTKSFGTQQGFGQTTIDVHNASTIKFSTSTGLRPNGGRRRQFFDRFLKRCRKKRPGYGDVGRRGRRRRPGLRLGLKYKTLLIVPILYTKFQISAAPL